MLERHEPLVSAGLWGGLKFCPVCHLIWPCLEGKILAYRGKRSAEGSYLNVRQIRERIEAEERAQAVVSLPQPAMRRRVRKVYGAAALCATASMATEHRMYIRLRIAHPVEVDGRRFRGPMKRALQQRVCKKGHPLTEDNLVFEKDGEVRRCRKCRQESLHNRLRRNHRARPPETGKCMAGLHDWVAENWLPRAGGGMRCRACATASQKKFYVEKHWTPCIAGGCERATYRADAGDTYICRTHREKPPAWIAASGQVIRGTRLVRVP